MSLNGLFLRLLGYLIDGGERPIPEFRHSESHSEQI
jgi:hypothetical protein